MTTTSLPPGLPPGGGGSLSIVTTQFPDAIVGRAYNLVINTTGGSGILSPTNGCIVVSGTLPAGLTWTNGPGASQCTLGGTVTATDAVKSYAITVQATDTSQPPKTDSLPYTITVRADYTITQAALVDAVAGRTYGTGTGCLPLSACTQTTTTSLAATEPATVGSGAALGNGPLTACTLLVTPSNPGLVAAVDATHSQCLISSAGVTGAGGAYSVTVTTTDTPIAVPGQTGAAVPAEPISKKFNLTVHPSIQLTQSLLPAPGLAPGTWPDAVSGRAYGSGAGCTAGACGAAVYTATGGLSGAGLPGYVWPAATPASISAVTGMSCPVVAVGSATYTCSTAKITAAPTSAGAASQKYSPSVTVTDTANQATPPATVATDALSTRTDTLNVDAPLLEAMTQATVSGTNPPSLLAGVVNRSYGVVGSAPTYVAAGGLGANPVASGGSGIAAYEWCVKTGTALPPAGLGPGAVAITANCPSFFSTGIASVPLTANPIFPSANTTASPITYPFTVELDDAGNVSTPNSVASSTPSDASPTSIIIDPPLVATLTQSTNPTPTTALLPGVSNRSYGVISSGAGAPTFTSSGGLGMSTLGLGVYQWCISTGALPAGFLNTGTSVNTPCTSPDVENTATLSANAISSIVASPQAFTFTIRLDDQGNPAVPSGVTSGTTNAISTVVTVNPQINLAQSLGTTWPDAVNGRPYGSGTGCTGGGACAPALYTATFGLGGYVYPGGTPTSVPTGFACVQGSGATLGNYTCNATTVTAGSSTPAAASVTLNPVVSVTDTANAATPAATTATDPLSIRSPANTNPNYVDTIVVDAPLLATLTQATLAGNNPANLLDGVANRTYGVVGAAPTYAAGGGLGAGALGASAYEWCAAAANGLPPTGLGPGAASVTAKCPSFFSTATASVALTANPIAASAAPTTPTPYPFTVELDDTGNGSTPASSATAGTASDVAATTLTVQPPLAATLTQNGATVASGNPLLPGVNSRSYGVVNSAAGAPTFTAAGGLGLSTTGLGAYKWCISAGALPTGFINTGTNLNNSSTCAAAVVENTATLQANPAITSAGSVTPFSFTVRLDDGGNAAVPSTVSSGTLDSTVATSILVNPQITLTTNLGPAWPDAVDGRLYGQGNGCTGGACTAMIYTAAGGLGAAGGYTFPTQANFPTPIACATASPTLTCSAGSAITQAAGPTHPTVTAIDVANAATPVANTTTDPQSTRGNSDSLIVDPPLLATLNQNGTPNPANLIPGVSGRSYGTIGAAPTYTATGGLGATTVADYEWCVDTGTTSLPAGLTGIAGGGGISGPCTNFGPTGTATATLSSANVTGAAATYPFTVELDDTGNASTPSSASHGTDATRATSLLINAPLVVALTQNGTTIASAGALLPGVIGRSYGVINANAGEPTYTASGGLGAVGGYTFPASPGPFGAGSGFTCSPTTTNPYVCSAGSVALAASAISYPLSLTVLDSANPAVPQGNAVSTASLLVDPEIVLSLNLGTSWPNAVKGRAYGSGVGCSGGGGCTAAIYTASNGLGTYVYPASTPASMPAGMACAAAGATYTCDAPTGITAAAGPYGPTFAVTDTANAATPAAIIATDPQSHRTTDSVQVVAEMVITPPGAVPIAVAGRSYGFAGSGCSGGACATLNYGIANGLGNYVSPAVMTSTAGTFSCPLSGATYQCSSTNITGSGTPGLSLNVSETGNGSTPGNTVNDPSKTLTINPEMNFTAPGGLLTFTTAVTGRNYGTGNNCGGGSAACIPLTYTMNGGGLSGYSYALNVNGTAGGFTCTGSGATTTSNCSASPVTAAGGTTYSSVHASVTDTGNASTPSNTIPSSNDSLPVNNELVLTPPASPIPTAVQTRTYGQGSLCGASGTAQCATLDYGIANGLGNYTSPATMTTTAGVFACPLNVATYQCSSGDITGSGAPNLSLTASETGNASTPGNSKTDNSKSLTINPEITVTAPTVPTAVHGRAYGSTGTCSPNPTCAPLAYSLNNGLGLYTSTNSSLIDGPDAFTLSFATPTYSFSATAISGAGGTNPTLTFTGGETGNASTPAKTVTDTNKSLATNAEMTVTPPGAVPTAVTGRAYGTGSGCSGGSCTALAYSLSNGLGNYTLTGSSLATTSDTFGCTLASSTFSCSKAAIAGTSNLTLTFTGAETGNASTPGHSVTNSFWTLNTNPEMAFTAPNGNLTFAAAVNGRNYGVGTNCGVTGTATCAALAYTMNGGGLSGYSYAFTVNSDAGGFTCTGSGATTTSDCSASPVTAAANASPYTSVHASVTDTANASTPTNTIPSANDSLTVNPEITVTAPVTVPPTVHNRAYGTGSGCSGGTCAPIQYSLNGGLGLYTLTGSSLTTPADTFTCSLATSTFSCSVAPIAGAGGTNPTLTFKGAETGNASTPGNTVTDTQKSVVINNQVALAQSLGASWPDGVNGRAYGGNVAGCYNGASTVNCASAVYTASNGLGSVGGYIWPALGAAGNNLQPLGFSSCALSTVTNSNDTDSCSAASISALPSSPGGPSISYGPSVTVTDTPNASTPAATTGSDPNSIRTDTMWVDAPLLATLTQNAITNPPNLLPGVSGRSYGTIGAAPTYTATGGLGARTVADYEWCVSTGAASLPAGLGGIGTSCSPFTTTGAATETLTSSNITAAITPPSQNFTPITVELADTGNTSTPSSVASTTSVTNSTSLLINAALEVHLTQTGDTPSTDPANLLAGVNGRTYGVIGGTPTYTASYGLGAVGGYTFPASPGPFSTVAGFGCSSNTTNPYTCSASTSVTAAAATYSGLSLTVNDAANAAVPQGSANSTTSLLVNAPLSASFTQNANSLNPNPATLFDGVAGRSYGIIGSPVAYSVTGGFGTGTYQWCLTGSLPTGLISTPTTSNTCTLVGSTTEDTFNLTASPVSSGAAGLYTGITAEAGDAGNAAVPDSFSSSASSTTSATKITIDPEIVIQNAPQLPNGELNQPYSVLFTCQAPLVTGVCGGTGNPDNPSAVYTWSAPTNNVTGVGSSFPVAPPAPTPPLQATYAAIFSGTPTATGTGETVTVSITDDGNAATPSCATAATCPLNTGFSANILPSQAYVGSNTNNAVDVFDTSAGVGSVTLVGSPIAPTAGTTPNYPAASSNGTYVFVADPGAFQLDIINTSAGSFTTVTGLGKPATGDAAAVALGPQAIPGSLSNPDSLYAYVANSVADNVQVIDAKPGSGTYGTVISPMAFISGSYGPSGASDIKVAPTFNTGTSSSPVRVTHGYVLRVGGDEVCVIDAEPSSGTFQSAIPAANNPSTTDKCISLIETTTTPNFIDISPDGRYLFVTEGFVGTSGYLEVIDTNPNDASTFETVISVVNLTSFTTNPAGVRVSPDGQTLWVAGKDVSGLLGIETAKVGAAQFSFLNAIPTPTPTTDAPVGIAFRPDGVFGLATLSNESPTAILPFTTSLVGTGFVGPWNIATPYVIGNEVIYTDGNYYLCLAGNTGVTPPSSLGVDWQMVAAGADVDTSVGSTPWGIDHVPNPVLHITTTALPAATNSVAYDSSIVAAGPNRFYTFTELTASEVTTLGALGLTLSPDGEVTATTPASLVAGDYSFVIQVTDQSQPVNNLVVKTITLHVN
ncbi:MAG: hypothetical protein ABSF45_03320 [Terriglobia bacterium]